MLWLLIVTLALTMFLVMAAFALTFCSVAFAGWNGGAAQLSTGSELSTMSGKRLQAWAANLAHRVVARHAHQPRSADTPVAIATELEAGASEFLGRAAHRIHSDVSKMCPDTRPRQIAVTAPEVFAIAAELEQSYPKSEQQIIRELASLNARRSRFMLPEEFQQAGINCPLQAEDGHCLTFTNRPIACRRECSSCAGGAGCGDAKDQSSDSVASIAEQLHKGMADGLSEGLRQVGLDGDTYDLNDALVTALTMPNAAARWSRGEAVFANCVKA
ncbi:MAG: hypothetical protein NT013_05135 [Planctomycetia bacterium]|nr:hypothetical protein [Planctomycetia bacterium]